MLQVGMLLSLVIIIAVARPWMIIWVCMYSRCSSFSAIIMTTGTTNFLYAYVESNGESGEKLGVLTIARSRKVNQGSLS